MLVALVALASGLAPAPILGCGPKWGGSIGAILVQRPSGQVYVKETPPDHAASRAGIEVGDEIVSIDGKDTRKMSPAEVRAALRGPVGTKVKLGIERRGERREVIVERGPLE